MTTEPISDPAALDDFTRDALRRSLLSLADSKRVLGIRYSDWLLGAPTLESGIAASSMAQDEWGHARLVYAMLREFGEDPVKVEHDRPAAEYASISALDEPLEDWAALVAGIVLVDGALTIVMEGLAQGSYEPARARFPKMVSEEAFHASMGAAWFRSLTDGSDEAVARLLAAVRAQLPVVLRMLDPRDEEAEALARAGVLPPGSESAGRFRAWVEALVESLVRRASGEEAAVQAVELLSQADPEWDSRRRRGPGTLAEEAAERARGDRNRELFVE